MAFQISKVKYSGKINEVLLGTQKMPIGGNSSYAFNVFEGDHPHKPKLALEVWDYEPVDDWAQPLQEAFAGVMGDPGAWAKKCVEYGADCVSVQLKSTDPNGDDKGPEHACEVVGKVLAAVDVPVIVYGVDNKEKDVITLSAVAEKFQGKNLVLGPVTDVTYKQIGAQAMAYGHSVAARSPIDVNLAKQLNILLGGLGLTKERILIDPTCGGLGYGMEYTYSVMERLSMAALVQQDDNLQQPIITPIGEEVWKCKEAHLCSADHPTLGNETPRGVLMETSLAISMLISGAALVLLNHPESLKLVREYINAMYDGGAVKTDNLLKVETLAPCGCAN